MKAVTVRAEPMPLPPRPSTAKVVLRAMITIAVFALVGPVIGGVVTIAGFVAFGFNMVSFSNAGLAILSTIVYGLWVAYPIGLLPAALVGIVVAIRDNFGSGTRFHEAALLGLVFGVGWGFIIDSNPSGNRLFAWLVVAGSVAGAVGCWWLTRRWKRIVGARQMQGTA